MDPVTDAALISDLAASAGSGGGTSVILIALWALFQERRKSGKMGPLEDRIGQLEAAVGLYAATSQTTRGGLAVAVQRLDAMAAEVAAVVSAGGDTRVSLARLEERLIAATEGMRRLLDAPRSHDHDER